MAKEVKRSTILTDAEVKAATDAAGSVLGRECLKTAEKLGFDFDATMRLKSLGARCQEERRRFGLGIKEVATQLDVPQYRIRAVENCRQQEIMPDVLRSYLGFLELAEWAGHWAEANPELARHLGLVRPSA